MLSVLAMRQDTTSKQLHLTTVLKLRHDLDQLRYLEEETEAAIPQMQHMKAFACHTPQLRTMQGLTRRTSR